MAPLSRNRHDRDGAITGTMKLRHKSIQAKLLRIPLVHKIILIANSAIVAGGALLGTGITIWHVTRFPNNLHMELVVGFLIGGVFLYPSATRLLLEDYLGQLHNATNQDLYDTLSERAVLKAIALGHTAKEVAEQLTLSPKTVETYRTRIMEKLGLQSRADLVKYALARGLLDPYT